MAHQYMPKIFHGPLKNPPALPPTYLMYVPLLIQIKQIFLKGASSTLIFQLFFKVIEQSFNYL